MVRLPAWLHPAETSCQNRQNINVKVVENQSEGRRRLYSYLYYSIPLLLFTVIIIYLYYPDVHVTATNQGKKLNKSQNVLKIFNENTTEQKT